MTRYLTNDGVEVEAFTGKLDVEDFIWVTHPTLGLAHIQLRMLTEVKPLMAEQPDGSVVRVTPKVGSPFIAERDDDVYSARDGKVWFTTIGTKPKSWAEILEVAESITLLVPDPLGEPVELPLHEGPIAVGYDPTGLGGGPHRVVVRVRTEAAHILPVVARSMARALWTAADNAERDLEGGKP